jgi:hypothetical protein
MGPCPGKREEVLRSAQSWVLGPESCTPASVGRYAQYLPGWRQYLLRTVKIIYKQATQPKAGNNVR